ncbi:hypothetical protein HMPREF3201_01213 [Megasphaera sp. MJR8396C]|nr:hypothetical protein HMPREF3201_01213 [Megasphaera sp. MJR8396C]
MRDNLQGKIKKGFGPRTNPFCFYAFCWLRFTKPGGVFPRFLALKKRCRYRQRFFDSH